MKCQFGMHLEFASSFFNCLQPSTWSLRTDVRTSSRGVHSCINIGNSIVTKQSYWRTHAVAAVVSWQSFHAAKGSPPFRTQVTRSLRQLVNVLLAVRKKERRNWKKGFILQILPLLLSLYTSVLRCKSCTALLLLWILHLCNKRKWKPVGRLLRAEWKCTYFFSRQQQYLHTTSTYGYTYVL